MNDLIDGVLLSPLRQFFDERGKVMHMLREDDDHFEKFGEIYFSCTFPDVVKAWHKHSEMKLNYACVSGSVKVVLYDTRESSETFGRFNEFILSPENYYLLTVPPMVWNGFKAIGTQMATVANCATIAHRSNEITRLSYDASEINYDWNIKHF
ncbi:dTDP-4-dehydrorhamnose epimerase [marine gamma proteobacterium HTCC2207]|jgi:dTDP-4-dehydrorhamnose 3,5-epimerase|uniref:dTDP-4-dehydrorhamnose 3,5-epimerase n=1 Tax=gamma proteobacterium HTCC2207 TaxID=314287 RepID=Q1YPS3_9GAMM|nr:dTDP-4-dehydrorhamnose epimerase [marine gamma proteobacterium HTCC2207] [gamma proteobacterium HTCC2207]